MANIDPKKRNNQMLKIWPMSKQVNISKPNLKPELKIEKLSFPIAPQLQVFGLITPDYLLL